MTEYHFTWRPFAGATIAFLGLFGAVAHAQLPRQSVPSAARAQRAREACDAVASRYGYRIVRRDSAKTNGTMYEVPLHVAHGAAEADVICRYDIKAGSVALPAWDERTGQPARPDRGRTERTATGLPREAFVARQECENYINSRPGFRVQRVGTPVALGLGQWDVPLTARQDGHTDIHATCRYIRATGTVSLRPR